MAHICSYGALVVGPGIDLYSGFIGWSIGLKSTLRAHHSPGCSLITPPVIPKGFEGEPIQSSICYSPLKSLSSKYRFKTQQISTLIRSFPFISESFSRSFPVSVKSHTGIKSSCGITTHKQTASSNTNVKTYRRIL